MRGIGIGVEIEEDAINELINDILAVSDGLDDMNPQLTQLAINVQNQLRQGNFQNRTGNLRRSMRVFTQDNSLTIRMLYYGYFLSFGTRDGAKSPLTAGVASAFPGKSEGSFFKQPDNNRGIAARRFYPTNIEERVAAALEAMLTEDLD